MLENFRLFLKCIVGKLIEKLEKYDDELVEIGDKFVGHNDAAEYIKSDAGAVVASRIYKTRLYKVYRIELESGKFLECADNHILFDTFKNEVFAKDLRPGHFIYTEDGREKIERIIEMPYRLPMYDLSVVDECHRYYTNGILSHNTTTTAAFLTYYMVFHHDRNCAIVANKGDTAISILKKTKEVLAGLPFFMKPGVLRLGERSVTFENGCYLKCASTNPSSITGDTQHLVYCDEFALIPKNLMDAFWQSVYPTLSSSKVSQIIVSSTPRGKNNIFFDIYDKSVKGLNDFVSKRVDWWQVPGHDEAWAEAEKKNFGEENFAQEYGLQFDTDASRLISANNFRFMRAIKKKFESVTFSNVPEDISNSIIWHPDFHPETLAWKDLMQRKFVFVVDTAEGKEVEFKGKKDSDYNVINIFEVQPLSARQIMKNRFGGKKLSEKDCVRYVQVGMYIDNEKDEERAAEALKHLIFRVFKNGQGDEYSGSIDNSRILLEMNFNGKNFLNIFKSHKDFYGNLVLKTYHTKPVPGQMMKKKYGFKTTGGSKGKSYYCELGAKMISQRKIIVSQYDDDLNISTIGELENFAKNPKKGGYEGTCVHDDISVTVLFLSRLNDIDEFDIWLQEWLDNAPASSKTDNIKKLLDTYDISDDSEGTLSDEEFAGLYLNGNVGGLPMQQMIPGSHSTYSRSISDINNINYRLGRR